jgi:hypothetical protein
MYQPAYQPPHRSASDMIKSFVSDTLLAVLFLVALLLVMIGSWLIGLMDTEGGVNVGQVLRSLGVTGLVGGALIAALLRHDMDKYIRAAMLIFATALFIFVDFWYIW